MDQGGNLPNTVGVGADLTFGTGDDVDVDFGEDTYVAQRGLHRDRGHAQRRRLRSLDRRTGSARCSRSAPAARRSRPPSRSRTGLPTPRTCSSSAGPKGDDTTQAELGDPTSRRASTGSASTTRPASCAARSRRRAASAPASPAGSRPGRPRTPNGFTYTRQAAHPDGTQSITLKSGAVTEAQGDLEGEGRAARRLAASASCLRSSSRCATARPSVCFGGLRSDRRARPTTPLQFKAKTQ